MPNRSAFSAFNDNVLQVALSAHRAHRLESRVVTEGAFKHISANVTEAEHEIKALFHQGYVIKQTEPGWFYFTRGLTGGSPLIATQDIETLRQLRRENKQDQMEDLLRKICTDPQWLGETQGVPVGWYKQVAEQGEATGQLVLGWMYADGTGVAQDTERAVHWYRQAAEQGNAPAQCGLGFMYHYGTGVAQDAAQAVHWYRQAAEQGDATAQCNLGCMYDHGLGVIQDATQAVHWYRKAAEQGNVRAQCTLGLMYDDGMDVAQDTEQAVHWYRKAAEQGDVTAQCNLGYMYAYGTGVAQDAEQAVYWHRKAAEQGNTDAINELNKLKVPLPPPSLENSNACYCAFM